MTDLENKLRAILSEKNEKLKPEIIKVGETVFDIEGTYEGEEVDITTLEEYKECLAISESILGEKSYYEEISYLIANGTQYIITDISYSNENTYDIETDIAFCGLPTGETDSLSGWDAGGSYGLNMTRNLFNGSEASSLELILDTFYKLKMKITNGTTYYYINDTQVLSRTNSSLSSYASLNFPIFALASKNTIKPSQMTVKIKNYRISINGSLTADFVPIRENTAVFALLDKVTNKIYYNSGTGQFVGGVE